MKKKSLLMGILGVFISTGSFANEVCKNEFGTLRCGSGMVDDINYLGYVDANGTTVSNMVSVRGNVTANNTHFNNVSIKGESHFTNSEIVGQFQMTGNINTKEVNFDNKADITGNFFASHTILRDATNVIGMINCEYCTFRMDTTIVGDITIENSQFIKNLMITTKKANFSSSKLNDLYIKKQNEDVEQVVYLNKGSQVHNVTFENQKGVIILSGNSQINGNIQGGKVVKN